MQKSHHLAREQICTKNTSFSLDSSHVPLVCLHICLRIQTVIHQYSLSQFPAVMSLVGFSFSFSLICVVMLKDGNIVVQRVFFSVVLFIIPFQMCACFLTFFSKPFSLFFENIQVIKCLLLQLKIIFIIDFIFPIISSIIIVSKMSENACHSFQRDIITYFIQPCYPTMQNSKIFHFYQRKTANLQI